jgi:hypothetical protein
MHRRWRPVARPFFDYGWSSPKAGLQLQERIFLATEAAIALFGIGEYGQCIAALTFSLESDLSRNSWRGINIDLCNLASAYAAQNKLERSARCVALAVTAASRLGSAEEVFCAKLRSFEVIVLFGSEPKAVEAAWHKLNHMGWNRSRSRYRPGDMEVLRAEYLFAHDLLSDSFRETAEELALSGQNRQAVRRLRLLRGRWRLDNNIGVGSASG